MNRLIIIDGNNRSEVGIDSIPGLIVEIAGGDSNIIEIRKPYKFSNCKIKLNGNSNTVEIGRNANISNTIINMGIQGDGRLFSVGSHFTGATVFFSLFENNDSIIIGDDCFIKSNTNIQSSDGHTLFDCDSKKPLNFGGKVRIGNHVFIGTNTFIGKNIEIRDNTVVLPASNVVKSIDKSDAVVAGNPAAVIKDNIEFSYGA